MDLLGIEELRGLFRAQGAPCVSLYMPTHRVVRTKNREDPIRLKNLLRVAERGLIDRGLRAPEARQLLQPAADYLDDSFFWEHQSDGLAVLLSAEVQRLYRLPIIFQELVIITERFHIRPLLQLLLTDRRFYLLALSQNEVRLMEGSRHALEEIGLESVPANLKDALGHVTEEEQLQLHLATRPTVRDRGAIYHGHGRDRARTKDLLLRYFRQIDEGLGEAIGADTAPLVLAGVDYYFPIYRAANTYPFLLKEGITGNPEGLRPEELHPQAWRLVEPLFREERDKALATYRDMVGTGRTRQEIKEVAEAARYGRVDVLFVRADVEGDDPAFDSAPHPAPARLLAANVSASDRDRETTAGTAGRPTPGTRGGDATSFETESLLETAAAETLLRGGSVFALSAGELPDESSPVAAILRF